MRLDREADPATELLRSLGALRRPGPSLVLQILFRRVPRWETGWFSRSIQGAIDAKEGRARLEVERRAAEPAYHVEIRLAGRGSSERDGVDAILPWLSSWTAPTGGEWWGIRAAGPSRRGALWEALRNHDVDAFAGRKARRDIAGGELASVLPLPWKERHPELSYSGAPSGRPPLELRSNGDRSDDVVVGSVGGDPVRLPPSWHHLAILGRTRSGKSTLARTIALGILAKQPDARVVVLEPTGSLISGLVARLPRSVAADSVEIDPSRLTFLKDGAEMVAVPLNLLGATRGTNLDIPRDFERRAEKVAGDVLVAIKNAWGEESVGGRADFILRSVVQGLTAVEGTNLVDAYTVLSDREALRRLERLAAGSPLRNALRVHLPGLDSVIRISSLDKVGKIATNPLLRKSLCQRYGAVDFGRLLEHRLLLLNLGKGALGAEGANFLGALFLTQLWAALQERAGDQARPVYLIVDEFHNYAIPAFADMLSEGARLGLHVIAVTQYLARIPDRIRSALVGNADAWAVFSVGAEDVREAWRIVRGEEFGWKPEDLAGGLAPFEAALYASRSLVKLSSRRELPPPPPAIEKNRRLVEGSSRRYARREDSQVSPLGVSQAQHVALLGKLEPGVPSSAGDIEHQLGWTPECTLAGIALANAAGNLVCDPAGAVRVTPRGRFFREAVLAARNEGEEHCGLFADTAAYLDDLGVSLQLGVQETVVPTPDGEFEHRGRIYSVEIECTNLVKHQEQVVRNVRKALAAGRRCLIAVADREAAERVAALVISRVPEAELWGKVGIVWRGGPSVMVPYSSAEREVWGWLLGREDNPEGAVESDTALTRPPPTPPPGSLDHEKGIVRELANRVRTLGKEWATARDLLDAVRPEDGASLSERKIGRSLAALGVPNRRVRFAGGQVRIYHVGRLAEVGPSTK